MFGLVLLFSRLSVFCGLFESSCVLDLKWVMVGLLVFLVCSCLIVIIVLLGLLS